MNERESAPRRSYPMISTLPPSEAIEPAPKRFSAKAKEDWPSASEALRSEVLRLERELTVGLEKHHATILELRNKIAELESRIADGDSTIETVMKFAADHPRLEELSEDIVFFLDTGRAETLAEAYDLAERFSLASSEPNLVDREKHKN